jgi:hypothetical protein
MFSVKIINVRVKNKKNKQKGKRVKFIDPGCGIGLSVSQ